MNRSRFAWWPLHRRKSHLSREPGAALFQGLRIRLTLWYCGVLGAALVLFSVALYVGVQYFLLTPVEADTAGHAHAHVEQWLTFLPDRACSSFTPRGQFGPPPGQGFPMLEMVACFDQNGSLLPNNTTASLPPAFLTNTLAKSALQTDQPATDNVEGGVTVGRIYRYALAVPNPTGSGHLGVVLIGESIQTQETALSLLLLLLLGVGGVALLGAGGGGLFLANRALAPARLAWTNQQRFIADASHELRTPLTLLRADAEVLLRSRERLGAEDAALLEDIVAEAKHMARLSNNMLTLARLDTRSSHREHEVVNLTELAIVGARRVHALADETEIGMQVEAHEAAVVIGDPALLEQAVLALLDNAIKYNRRGGRVIVRTAVQDELALLEVCDTGIGIAAEHLPHLGERFYRVDKARSRQAGGTGLGLSIVRSIADVHGGQLALTSTPKQGTRVTLTLPLAQGTSPEPLQDTAGIVASLPERSV
ncbi:MAG TPA: ATP-binding protein [Ktedonobacteraceae bacterium]